MNILVTGAKGFVGRNLVSQLHNIQSGKAKNYGVFSDMQVFEYDVDSDPCELDVYCKRADFVFNLAGVNRPKDQAEFMQGNFGFASALLDTLKKYNNSCPVMISSSTQAALDNPYGESKRAGENLCLIMHGRQVHVFLFTVFRMCLVNGAVQIITVPLPLFVTT